MTNKKTLNYWYESYYPITFSLLILTLIIKFKLFYGNINVVVDKLSDNAISISVTLLGFFLTILTILNSIETRRMIFIKTMGAFPRLLHFLKLAITYNVYLIASSFFVKYIEHRNSLYYYLFNINLVDYGYLFFVILTMLISLRFTLLFVSLLADPKAN